MLKSIKKTITLNVFKEKNAVSITKSAQQKIVGGIDRGDSYKPNKHIGH